jgi:hypothetical protein
MSRHNRVCPIFRGYYNFQHGNGCRATLGLGDRFVSSDVSSKFIPHHDAGIPMPRVRRSFDPLTSLCNGVSGIASIQFRTSPHRSVALLQSSVQEQVTHRLDSFTYLSKPFTFRFSCYSVFRSRCVQHRFLRCDADSPYLVRQDAV